MATERFLSKQYLIDEIRKVASGGGTGILTILTDTRRSVLIRFSSGRLVQVRARTRDVGEALNVLQECGSVKYTFVTARTDDAPEVMPVDSFVELLSTGVDAGGGPPGPAAAPAGPAAGAAESGDDQLLPQFAELLRQGETGGGRAADPNRELKQQLVVLTLEYVGPVASMIVDDAMEPFVSVVDSIDRIASMIPDDVESGRFREAARRQFGE